MAKLYIVGTPIGNLGDISTRCLETLSSVDFIACEDTRVTSKLLARYDIKKPLISYYEHNRAEKGQYIASRIAEGENCALVTDAGTPAISDPGTDLVKICQDNGLDVVAVPGPSAVISALSISGMDCGRFCFEGFLSVNNKSRREHLEDIKNEKRTMVFYEAPHKLLRTLKDFYAILGDREIALCRELTKIHEEVFKTTLCKAVEHYEENPPKGEFVLIIAGKSEDENEAEEVDGIALVNALVEEGMSTRDAVKQIAKQYNLNKNQLYKDITSQ